MQKSPEISWLERRWSLPEGGDASKAVESLLNSEKEDGSTAYPLPDNQHDAALWGSAATMEPETHIKAPLVIVSKGGRHFLQTRRCHLAEQSIARRIRTLATETPLLIDEAVIQACFPGADGDDLQVMAARTALSKKVLLITGGPGTGKTYTLARILALMLTPESGIPEEKIALAAPTGKAADRMKGAIKQSLQGLDEETTKKLNKVSERSMTLHKLMGSNPVTGRCRHNKDNQLPWKLLIVDECSMIDTHLWKALLESLKDDARIILLGDPKQLQSVGQGNVFGDLAEHADQEESFLHGCKVHLTQSRRFADCPKISALAAAMQKDKADEAERLLLQSNDPGEDLLWINVGEKPLDFQKFPPTLKEALVTAADAANPDEALAALRKICILTPHRNSLVGAESLSRSITAALAGRRESPRAGIPPNEPIIINRNDPETGLRNGAVGILHTDQSGNRKAYFPRENQSSQYHPLGALPDHSPAWAITIHRSQGSEYDQVFVILPRKDSVMATRELLYTAITRARNKVLIAGSMEAVKKAVSKPANRVTLLKQALDRIF